MDYQMLRQLIPKKSALWTAHDVIKWLQFIQLPKLV